MTRKLKSLSVLSILFISLLVVALLFVAPKMSIKAVDDPVLIDFKMSKTTINTDAGADSITVYARASTIQEEGYVSIHVSIAPEDGCSGDDCWQPQAQNTYLSKMYEDCDLLEDFNIDGLEGGCGDGNDGIFYATFDFPQYSAVGDWKVYSIRLDDGVGGQGLVVPISLDTFTATTNSGERNIKFTNEGVTEDIEGPVIEDHAFESATIDTTDGSESLTIYLRISDELSGVKLSTEWGPEVPRMIFQPDNDPGYAETESVEFELSLMTEGCDSLPGELDVSGLVGCGDEMDGIYTATVEVPQYSTGGTWRVSGVWNLADLVGNATETYDATFNNASTEYDLTAPEIKSITVTPTVFDTRSAEQKITFDIELEDDMAGVKEVDIMLMPVITGWEEAYWLSEYTILGEGTTRSGVFRFEVTLPQGSSLGFWRVNHIDVKDELNRQQRYTTSRLSLEFPDLSLYLVNQGTTDEVTLQGDWTLEDWPYYQEDKVVWPDISVRFKEGTVITKRDGGEFAFHRMLATKYNLIGTGVSDLLANVNSDHAADLAKCDSAEGCVGTNVNANSLVGTPLHIMKVGIPGLNLSFSIPVTIIIGVEPQYLGETFVIQTFDIAQQKWVNHGSCTAKEIVPPSTEHGGDQYGIIKPVTYAGCEFTTDHASFFSMNALGVAQEDPAGVPDTGFELKTTSWLNKQLGW